MIIKLYVHLFVILFCKNIQFNITIIITTTSLKNGNIVRLNEACMIVFNHMNHFS